MPTKSKEAALLRQPHGSKLNYIHSNPVHERWKLADLPENYAYSSARFYLLNQDQFGFITHYRG